MRRCDSLSKISLFMLQSSLVPLVPFAQWQPFVAISARSLELASYYRLRNHFYFAFKSSHTFSSSRRNVACQNTGIARFIQPKSTMCGKRGPVALRGHGSICFADNPINGRQGTGEQVWFPGSGCGRETRHYTACCKSVSTFQERKETAAASSFLAQDRGCSKEDGNQNLEGKYLTRIPRENDLQAMSGNGRRSKQDRLMNTNFRQIACSSLI